MMLQYVTFEVKGLHMGVEILLVREINRLMDTTRVQLAPDYVAGLVNLRGQIVAILDLSLRLGLEACKVTDEGLGHRFGHRLPAACYRAHEGRGHDVVRLRRPSPRGLSRGQKIGRNGDQGPDETHNIVLKSNHELKLIRARENRSDLYSCNDTVGLRVDSIGDMLEIEQDQIEPLPANVSELDERFFSGVKLLDDGLLFLLNIGPLLET